MLPILLILACMAILFAADFAAREAVHSVLLGALGERLSYPSGPGGARPPNVLVHLELKMKYLAKWF